METPLQPTLTTRRLLIIGGNLALDFANTVDDPDGPARYDHANSWADLLDWSIRIKAVSPGHATRLDQVVSTGSKRTTVRRAVELRQAITLLFGGYADGEPHHAEHWLALRPFTADAFAHATLHAPGTGLARLSWPAAEDPADLWRPIAVAATDLLRSNDFYRIKRCAQCPWLFVDHSRNHSRRWCSMDNCGTAVKMQRYITRRAAVNRQRTPKAK